MCYYITSALLHSDYLAVTADLPWNDSPAVATLHRKREGKGSSLAVQGVTLQAHASGTIGASRPAVIARLKQVDSGLGKRVPRRSG